MIVWLVYEIEQTNDEMMHIPMGPAFALTADNGSEITEAAFRQKLQQSALRHVAAIVASLLRERREHLPFGSARP